jgi:hypothetical protein
VESEELTYLGWLEAAFISEETEGSNQIWLEYNATSPRPQSETCEMFAGWEEWRKSSETGDEAVGQNVSQTDLMAETDENAQAVWARYNVEPAVAPPLEHAFEGWMERAGHRQPEEAVEGRVDDTQHNEAAAASSVELSEEEHHKEVVDDLIQSVETGDSIPFDGWLSWGGPGEVCEEVIKDEAEREQRQSSEEEVMNIDREAEAEWTQYQADTLLVENEQPFEGWLEAGFSSELTDSFIRAEEGRDWKQVEDEPFVEIERAANVSEWEEFNKALTMAHVTKEAVVTQHSETRPKVVPSGETIEEKSLLVGHEEEVGKHPEIPSTSPLPGEAIQDETIPIGFQEVGKIVDEERSSMFDGWLSWGGPGEICEEVIKDEAEREQRQSSEEEVMNIDREAEAEWTQYQADTLLVENEQPFEGWLEAGFSSELTESFIRAEEGRDWKQVEDEPFVETQRAANVSEWEEFNKALTMAHVTKEAVVAQHSETRSKVVPSGETIEDKTILVGHEEEVGKIDDVKSEDASQRDTKPVEPELELKQEKENQYQTDDAVVENQQDDFPVITEVQNNVQLEEKLHRQGNEMKPDELFRTNLDEELAGEKLQSGDQHHAASVSEAHSEQNVRESKVQQTAESYGGWLADGVTEGVPNEVAVDEEERGPRQAEREPSVEPDPDLQTLWNQYQMQLAQCDDRLAYRGWLDSEKAASLSESFIQSEEERDWKHSEMEFENVEESSANNAAWERFNEDLAASRDVKTPRGAASSTAAEAEKVLNSENNNNTAALISQGRGITPEAFPEDARHDFDNMEAKAELATPEPPDMQHLEITGCAYEGWLAFEEPMEIPEETTRDEQERTARQIIDEACRSAREIVEEEAALEMEHKVPSSWHVYQADAVSEDKREEAYEGWLEFSEAAGLPVEFASTEDLKDADVDESNGEPLSETDKITNTAVWEKFNREMSSLSDPCSAAVRDKALREMEQDRKPAETEASEQVSSEAKILTLPSQKLSEKQISQWSSEPPDEVQKQTMTQPTKLVVEAKIEE